MAPRRRRGGDGRVCFTGSVPVTYATPSQGTATVGGTQRQQQEYTDRPRRVLTLT